MDVDSQSDSLTVSLSEDSDFEQMEKAATASGRQTDPQVCALRNRFWLAKRQIKERQGRKPDRPEAANAAPQDRDQQPSHIHAFEVFSGSARLAQALATAGFVSIGIDFVHNKDTPRHKTLHIDLSTSEGQKFFWHLIVLKSAVRALCTPVRDSVQG